jgi:hypothetical protein
MKEITEHKYYVYDTITGKGKKTGYSTIEEAEEQLQFLKEFLIDTINEYNFIIEGKDTIRKEIEKGDKVHWIINDKVDYTRTDIVTKIIENAWGDIQYLTQEVGGNNRTGQAYLSRLVLAQ